MSNIILRLFEVRDHVAILGVWNTTPNQDRHFQGTRSGVSVCRPAGTARTTDLCM